MTDSELITYMHSALDTPLGIKLGVSDIEAFQRRFYKTRKACIEDGVGDFADLSLKLSPTHPLDQVWIVNNAIEKSRSSTGEEDAEPDEG